jgi:4-amino-4-deoxy-L-arabinose transferase-like glycosyltransferase
MIKTPPANKLNWFPGFLLALCMILYALLRLRFIDHVLTWDEAMNLLSTQAFFAGQENPYSFWFYRHPPVYALLLGLFTGAGRAWASSAILMNIALGVLLLLALLRLQTLAAGKTAALWGVFCYALMPAAMFFDVWIKRDLLVNLLGLVALHAFFRRRAWSAGVWLGLALLSKELALFYALPILAALFLEKDRSVWREVCKTGAMAALISFGWYVFFSTTGAHYFSFATGIELVETEKWARPWTDVWSRLPLNLGWAGILLLLPGFWILRKPSSESSPDGVLQRAAAWWPVTFAVPILLVLTLMKGKTPWFIIPVLPAFAALQGLGLVFIFNRIFHGAAIVGKVLLTVGVCACLVLLVRGAGMLEYDGMLERQAGGMAWGSQSSAAAARAVNEAVQPKERWAATPMFYWEGEQNALCPILLTAVLQPPDAVWPVPATAEELWARVQDEDMDWVLVSPTLEAANDLIGPLLIEKKVKAEILNGSILLDCRGLLRP